MKNIIYLWIALMGIITFSVHNSCAMPGEAHIEGIELLQGTSPANGGIGDMSLEKIKLINDWMDNPSRKTGEYFNRKVGGILTPSNHGALRHNPENVARALSGTGKVDKAIFNVARMHLVQDISHNSAQVNGWLPTSAMKTEAETILKHVNENRKLPKLFPGWDNKTGPLIRGSDKFLVSSTVETSSTVGRIGRDTVKMLKPGIRIAGKAVLPAAVAFEAGIALWECYETEEAFKRGAIDEPEKIRRHSVTVSKANGALMILGTGVVLTLCVTPAGPMVIIVAAAIVVAAYALEPVLKQLGLYAADIYNRHCAKEFAAYTKLSEKFYTSAEAFEITPAQMRLAGFPEADIAGYIQAASNMKESLQAKTDNMKIYEIDRTQTLMAFKEMEFLSNEIK